GTLLRGLPRGRRVGHHHDQRDSVPLGDRLAQGSAHTDLELPHVMRADRTVATRRRVGETASVATDETLVSTAERDAAARELREHVAEGRLTLEELSERLDRIYGARTRGALGTARGGLPAPAPRPPA